MNNTGATRRAAIVAICMCVTTMTYGQQALEKENRYACYMVESIHGSAQVPRVSLRDQFDRDKSALVMKPRYVCNPVDINGRGIPNSKLHIMCYEMQSTLRPKGPLQIGNDFERPNRALLNVKEAQLLCLPSTKRIASSK